jgi:nucleoside-diphosphate-sugar epimerase
MLTGYRPKTSIETGVAKFVEWYLNEYRGTKMTEAA